MVRAIGTLLSEKEPSPAYWKDMGILANALVDNELTSDVFAELRKSKLTLPMRVRFQHFVDIYEDYSYQKLLMVAIDEWESEEA